ncbi:MAG: hypothetical protein PHE89_05220 [Alphaproteobacteria bacterium]|nr:hypothetical protein [Alphaproteobacteria bacterium]
MIKATHYDVYVNYGDGWSLEQRFSEYNRQQAYQLVKEKEAVKVPVKVVCEVFDEIENNYAETVEYVSGLSVKQKPVVASKTESYDYKSHASKEIEKYEEISDADGGMRESIFKAILKIFLIIAIGIFLTNLCVSLFYPLIEALVPIAKVKASMFLIFFILFMLITIPLLLKKVPWDVFQFSEKRVKAREKNTEKLIANRAMEILSVYDLNTEQFPVAPVARNVSFEDKQEIVSFLSYLISSVDARVLNDAFLKLGMKFVLYGACIELSKHRGLSFAQANALLYEVFGVLDGDEMVNLESFYEAKTAYKDIEVAVFMAAVGSYLMHGMLNGKVMKENFLNICFTKWESLRNPEIITESEDVQPEVIEVSPFIVSIKSMIKFEDNQEAQNEVEKEALTERRNSVRSALFYYAHEFGGDDINEKDGLASVSFTKVGSALAFILNLQQKILEIQSDEKYMVFYNTYNIVEKDEAVDLVTYIQDIFVYNFNNEVILTQKVYDQADKDLYSFEDVGPKHLDALNIDVPLYKLNY